MLNIFGYLKLATLKFIDEFSKFIWVFVNSKFGTGMRYIQFSHIF